MLITLGREKNFSSFKPSYLATQTSQNLEQMYVTCIPYLLFIFRHTYQHYSRNQVNSFYK